MKKKKSSHLDYKKYSLFIIVVSVFLKKSTNQITKRKVKKKKWTIRSNSSPNHPLRSSHRFCKNKLSGWKHWLFFFTRFKNKQIVGARVKKNTCFRETTCVINRLFHCTFASSMMIFFSFQVAWFFLHANYHSSLSAFMVTCRTSLIVFSFGARSVM